MVIKNVNLETVCGITSTLPENEHPEFAFAGKSNVGKSSLINGIMNRKNYARTSQEPGKTQTINYYNINDEFYLVDLPGYGFARVPEKVKAQWGEMVERYLHSSKQLLRVFLLIDIRHEPSAADRSMIEFLNSASLPYFIVFTKCDKLSKMQVRNHIAMMSKHLDFSEDAAVFAISSDKKEGIGELTDAITEFVF